MSDLTFTLLREPSIPVPGAETFTPGVIYANGLRFGFSCEDEDRKLESGGLKVKGKTAIPRGRYRLTVTMSNRFKKLLPLILDTPQFTGARCHGGNKAEDSEGCVLMGQVRTRTGIAQCADTVQRMILMIRAKEAAGDQCWLEVK